MFGPFYTLRLRTECDNLENIRRWCYRLTRQTVGHEKNAKWDWELLTLLPTIAKPIYGWLSAADSVKQMSEFLKFQNSSEAVARNGLSNIHQSNIDLTNENMCRNW